MCVGPAGRHEGTPGVAPPSVGLPWTVCDSIVSEGGRHCTLSAQGRRSYKMGPACLDHRGEAASVEAHP